MSTVEAVVAVAVGIVSLLTAGAGAFAFAFKLGNIAKESEARDAAIEAASKARDDALDKAHADLEARHREGITGVRDRQYKAEGDIAGLKEARAETVVRLDTIVERLGQIQAALAEQPPARKRASKPR